MMSEETKESLALYAAVFTVLMAVLVAADRVDQRSAETNRLRIERGCSEAKP